MSYPNQLFSALAFIGFVFCAIPFYWHLESWNVGTCLFMAWAGLGCLNAFINSVVWNNSVQNFAPVWCDISSRFIVGLNVAIPAAVLVIAHRLFKIASRTAALSTRAEKRRAVLVDLAIGLGIPLVQMPLQLVVEGHRFDILEEIGCVPATFNVTLAFPLVYIWPLVLSIVAAVYSVLTICLFWKSSQHLKEMSGSNKNLNHNRYMRLMALSGTQLLINLPMNIYNFYTELHNPISPWISWKDTHLDYSFVGQLHSNAWRLHLATPVEWARWSVIVCAFSFFIFFGFAEEARKHYHLAYSFSKSRLHLGNSGTRSASSSLHSPNTSFGPSFRRGMATLLSFKDTFSPSGSRRGPELATESKAMSSVSEYRLTSDDSVFEGVDAQLKALGIVPENPTHPHQATVITLPTASHYPVPPQILSIPPTRLDSPLPHRPVSAPFDSSERV